MSKYKRIMVMLSSLVVLILLPPLLLASTTGKIAGVVEDGKTGEPIPGATIRVAGTELGTQTDADGEYFLLNLPAGAYTIEVSVIGFQSVQKHEVRVLLDLTTPVDFEIEQVDYPLKRKVKVYAERPPIQRDLTASRSIVTSDQLAFIPNSRSVGAIMSNMAGTVVDRDNSIHVRGGRTGQVSYFYDGFSIQDPFTGNAGLRIMPDALEEVNLTSGGFSAEYGEALSGILNAVSKDGSQDYHGKIKFYDGYTHRYDVNTAEFSDISRSDNVSVSYNLSGPVPLLFNNRIPFFLASEYLTNGGYLPHSQATTWTHHAKLNFQPTPNLKFTGVGSYYKGEGEYYNHRDVNGYSYDFNQDGLGISKAKSYLYGIKSNYNISAKSVLQVSFNHFYTERKTAPEHLFDLHWSEWPGYSEDANGEYNGTIHEDNYLRSQEYLLTGFTSGDDFEPTYGKRFTKYNGFAANWTSQINRHNEIRFGAEYRKLDVFWDFRQFYNDNPYGETYEHSPTYGLLYLQDKLELRDFVINAGVRWDYQNSKVEYWDHIWDKNKKLTSKKKSYFSPRLGVSHPIAENTVIRFNYGFYFQVPKYTFMYTNLNAEIGSGYPLVGNPDLKAEKTVAYELGLNHMLSDDIRLDITAYYKDIEDLIATSEVIAYDDDGHRLLAYGGNPVTQFSNNDYGSVKGFDVTVEKLAKGGFSGTIVYSYMIAKGNSSSAYENYYDFITEPEEQQPIGEFPLEYDQRHTATLNFGYRASKDWKGRFFGMSIPGAWGVNIFGRYGSGMPYTVTDETGRPMGGLNEGRLPANYSIDLRFFKDIFIFRSENYFSFFFEVENVFDRRNVINVYTNTGRPDDDGRDLSLYDEEESRLYTLMAKDPTNYSTPRTIRLGLEYNF